jgi:hypothetical protein
MKRVLSGNIRRQLTVLTAGLAVLFGAGLVSAPGASAAVASGCRTVNRSIWLQEGSVGKSVAEQRLALKVCWNTKGAITSSSLGQELYKTPLGTASGFELVSRGTANDHPKGGTSTAWHGSGRIRVCVVKGTSFCSDWEEWDTVVIFRTPGFVGPVGPNDHGATFDGNCTNADCHLRFINEIH